MQGPSWDAVELEKLIWVIVGLGVLTGACCCGLFLFFWKVLAG